MFSVLLAATLARYFFLRNSPLHMNQLGKFFRQIAFANMAVKTVQAAWCG
jgi:hypothetical protein